MKLPEPIIGEIAGFLFVVGIIGGICAVIVIGLTLLGLWDTIFDVRDQP